MSVAEDRRLALRKISETHISLLTALRKTGVNGEVYALARKAARLTADIEAELFRVKGPNKSGVPTQDEQKQVVYAIRQGYTSVRTIYKASGIRQCRLAKVMVWMVAEGVIYRGRPSSRSNPDYRLVETP